VAITLIIVGGIVVVTLITMVFDYMGKKTTAAVPPEFEKRLRMLEEKQSLLESALLEKEERIQQLSSEVSFVNKLLDSKSGK
jgi:hypothetical protein